MFSNFIKTLTTDKKEFNVLCGINSENIKQKTEGRS